VKIVWTDSAKAHLTAIHAYIAQDSPRYAQAMVDRITRRVQQCGQFPATGSRVPEYDEGDVREVLELPYRIIDRIRADRVDIVAVIHSARMLPESAP
jgi:toxin ParE1/3/4